MKQSVTQTFRGLKSAAAILFSSRLAVFALTSLNAVIVSRYLGPSGRGMLSLTIQIPSLIIMCGSFSLGMSGSYLIRHRGEEEASVGTWVPCIAFILGVIYVVATAAAYAPIKQYLVPNAELFPFLLALTMVPFTLSNEMSRPLMLALNRDWLNAFVDTFHLSLRVAILILFLVVFGMDYTAAILAIVLGSMVTFLLVFLKFILPHARSKSIGTSRDIIKKLFSYGSWLQLANIFQTISYRIDIFLVNYWMPIADVGYYSLAVSLSEMLRMFPSAIGAVVFPRLASMQSEEAARKSCSIFRKLVIIMLPPVALLYLLAEPAIVLLFGEAFRPSTQAVYALVPGIFMALVLSPFGIYYTSRGFIRFNSANSMFGMLVIIILDVIWIPKYGILGAAVASTVSYSMVAFSGFAFFCWVAKIKPWQPFMFERDDLIIWQTVMVKSFKRLRRPKGSENESG